MPDNLKEELGSLGWNGNVFKPHKLIAILAAIEVIERNNFSSNKVFFDGIFREAFSKYFADFASGTRNSCRAHTPFFHLRNSSFWSLVPVAGMDSRLEAATSVGGPGDLNEIVSHAVVSDSFIKSISSSELRLELCNHIKNCLRDGFKPKLNPTFQRVDQAKDEVGGSAFSHNPFVSYLNSLQRAGGGNENSLAEFQACNPLFPSIQVAHPLAQTIHEELVTEGGRHVILTGHAGDGKTTLALEIFKKLSGIDPQDPLPAPLKAREDIGSVSIIKDLSERDKSQDNAFVQELIDGSRRFLIISNTGTLLSLIKKSSQTFQSDEVSLESSVLKAISAEGGEASLDLGKVQFRIFNLARMDNIGIAKKVFERMLAPERWTTCSDCSHNLSCPIHNNVKLLQQNKDRSLERIFLAYRRMYEYGTRLSMRQFTEHLAYMITSGLDEEDVISLEQQTPRPLITEFLFYNRFFGDSGTSKDPSAFDMKAIQEIDEQGFGDRPCPGWEHRLWLRATSTPLNLEIQNETLEREFEKLRNHGARVASVEGMSPDQAREQVRRMLYFLYDFSGEERDYLGQYLNSPTLMDWVAWQQPDVQLSFNERTTLEQKIYHVLQEHFTGVRLPEGSTQSDRRLYVTLSRRRSEVRQSAQVVLAQVDWTSSTALKLVQQVSASGEARKDLVLLGKERIKDINLPLMLPFLDYVMMRHYGEVGEVLESSYLQRLDQFKAQIHSAAMVDEDEDRIMLVRLKTDHTFRRQHFAVNNNRLEVTDVL